MKYILVIVFVLFFLAAYFFAGKGGEAAGMGHKTRAVWLVSMAVLCWTFSVFSFGLALAMPS